MPVSPWHICVLCYSPEECTRTPFISLNIYKKKNDIRMTISFWYVWSGKILIYTKSTLVNKGGKCIRIRLLCLRGQRVVRYLPQREEQRKRTLTRATKGGNTLALPYSLQRKSHPHCSLFRHSTYPLSSLGLYPPESHSHLWCFINEIIIWKLRR